MSSNKVGQELTRYLGRGGNGKITANSSSVLQIANRCGGVAELAAGTYTIPTLESGQEMFWFWVKATGAVTITGAGTLATNEVAMVALDGSGWSMKVFQSASSASGAAGITIADAGAYTIATTVESALQHLMRDTQNVHVQLRCALDADGDPLAKWSAAPTPGFALVNTEALGLKWGANATHSVALLDVTIPQGWDTSAGTLTCNIVASKVGATVGDAVTFLIACYANTVGELHDAGADLGGTSTAMTGNATSKTVQKVTRSIAATGGASTAPTHLTFTIKPTDGTLGTDAVQIHDIYFTYTSAQ
jgi:hypothetical protein